MAEGVLVSSTVVHCPACGRRNRVPDVATGVPKCAICSAALPWITDAGQTSFATVAEAAAVPVLLDLWAPWCGPCRMVSPVLERLAAQFAGRVKLVKVNVDDAPDVARRFSVQGIPTLIVLSGGTEVARQTGAGSEPALRTWLEQALPRPGR